MALVRGYRRKDAAFAEHIVLSTEISMIGSENNDGVISDTKFIELVDDSANAVVNESYHCEICADNVANILFGLAFEIQHFVEHTIPFGC
jgi:hypothetical protein